MQRTGAVEVVQDHSLGLIAIRALATADTPQMNPTGNNNGPDCFEFSNGKNTAT